MSDWEIICLDGSAQPERLRFSDAIEIGRDPHCDLRLLGDAGSRFHARVSIDGEGPLVEDLGSRNGSWVGEDRIERHRLQPGELLRCGEARFALCPEDDGSQVFSDQGRALAVTVAQAPAGDEELDHDLARLLRALAQLPAGERLAGICRCAAGLHRASAGLMRGAALLAGDIPKRVARRLSGGVEPRLLQLGSELSGQTIADAAIGSAMVAPAGRGCHILLCRDVDAEAFTIADLKRLARFAADLTPLLPQGESGALPELLGGSEVMQRLRARVERLAGCDASVLITGPSGSGKELVARALHRLGGRAGGPFVAVNCAAVAEHLFEAELFGNRKGAFTGADSERLGRIRAADGGTLFLDEIGELPAAAQAKLLRVLQEGVVDPVGSDEGQRVNIRLLAATNVDLQAAVAGGRFREDLYHRIDVLRLRTPALDEHREDIPDLARQLIRRSAERLELPVLPLSERALAALAEQAWPGNIRQLGNALQRALVLAHGELIDVEDLELDAAAPAAAVSDPGFPTLAELEHRHIRAALQRAAGNKTQAAQMLGISRQTLHKKLAEED